jgi:hypothetical protein
MAFTSLKSAIVILLFIGSSSAQTIAELEKHYEELEKIQ